MRYTFTLFIILSITTVFGQYNYNEEWKGYCTHVPDPNQKTTDYLYYWQDTNMNNYDVTFYFLDIEVTSQSSYVSGSVLIYADVVVPSLDIFAFELIPEMTIDSFFFNGQQYSSYTRDGDNVLYSVDSVGEGEQIAAKIYYHGTPPQGNFFSGVTHAHNSQYNKDVTWTLSEPFNAKSWFPVKQDLEDKADSAWIFLTCGTNEMAGSNGLLTKITDLGKGKKRYEWKTKYPIDYYLISFAVSDYMDYSIYAHPEAMNGDSLLIQNYIYNSQACLNNNKDNIDKTIEIIETYSGLFSLYPFYEEKYGHCLTELGGGMEHQTMTTIGGFSFHLIAHELGHMWFGDNITCATWQDIWINEGFATYSDYLANEKILGWNSAQSFIKSAQNSAMSQPGGSIYIPEDEIYQGNEWRIFSGRLSYNKGAAILHTLRHEFQNDSLFFAGIQAYQAQFGGTTATGEDFKNVMEQFYGDDIDWFFEEWYYGQGYPEYNFEWYYNMSSDKFHLTSVQTTSSSATSLFKMLLDVKLIFDDNSDTIVRFFQSANEQEFVSYQQKTVVDIEIDPDNWTMEKVNSIVVGNVEKVENRTYFTFGPNPVKDYVTLYFGKVLPKNSFVYLTDMTGRVLINKNISDKEIMLNVSHLPKGTYLLNVTDGVNNIVKKLVK
jgi:aminopeptidase N